jgi:hypothetical protein
MLVTALDLATPKSTRMTAPFGLTMRLPGLTSRWIVPFSCAACSASAVCATIDMVSETVSRPASLSRVESGSPSTYAITRYAQSSSAESPALA